MLEFQATVSPTGTTLPFSLLFFSFPFLSFPFPFLFSPFLSKGPGFQINVGRV
jgi:hypothetical protein